MIAVDVVICLVGRMVLPTATTMVFVGLRWAQLLSRMAVLRRLFGEWACLHVRELDGVCGAVEASVLT